MKSKKIWRSIAVLVGSTVGVGIFGIPFAFSKAGLISGLLFLFGLTFFVRLLNLMYGEVILRTEGKHQLLGYAEKYLGKPAKRLLLFTTVFTVYGAMLAYIIISGTFLSSIFSGISLFSPFFYSTVFFVIVSLVVFAGLRMVSWLDLMMLFFFILLIGITASLGVPHISIENYFLFSKDFWFLPFGVILFALSGLSALPLMGEIVTSESSKLRSAINIGTLIPAGLYIIFSLVVVGISGEATSPDALSGLSGFLSSNLVLVGSIFGIVAVSTSFLGLSTALKESFQYDFGVRRIPAWFLVVIPPYLLFVLGMRNFIDIVSLVGGLALSLESIFIILLYIKAKKSGDRLPEYTINIPKTALFAMIFIFLAAAMYTLLT